MDGQLQSRRGQGHRRPNATDQALERLYAATAAVSAAIDDEPHLLRTVAEQFAALVNARYGALGILGEDGTLNEFYTHGLSQDDEAFLRPTPPVGAGILGEMLIEGRPLRIDDMEVDPRRAGMPIGHPPMRSFLGVPLIASSRVIGRLYATERRDGPFTPADESLAMGFAAAAAVAIESAWRTTRLVESERLRAAGELAIGIAHDFNNLLSTIIGRVEVMLATSSDPDFTAGLEAIGRAARDGAVIAGRMRRLGRAVDFDDFRPVDLREVARDAIEFTRPRWDRSPDGSSLNRAISMIADFGDTPAIDGDPVSIREALVNLLFNAIDAIQHSGTVTVRTKSGLNSTAVIEVIDDGAGIAATVLPRIFTPFYTTKGARGSGLGLAMVKRVVDGHRGLIDVESGEGEGTRFILTFPAIDVITREMPSSRRPAVADQRMVEFTPAPAARTASIVLVDDQVDVLQSIALLLQIEGHQVRAFESGGAAVESVVAQPPDVVITDLSMPEFSGWDVAINIHRVAPDIPVILLTGHAGTITPSEAHAKGIALVLAKPPDRDSLRRALEYVRTNSRTMASKRRVLIVDDSDGFRTAVALLLRSHGHIAVEAEGVQAAVAKARSGESFDVILLDAHLDDGDARTVAQTFRAANSNVVVWAMSGSDIETIRVRVPEADVYVEKGELSGRLFELSAPRQSRGDDFTAGGRPNDDNRGTE